MKKRKGKKKANKTKCREMLDKDIYNAEFDIDVGVSSLRIKRLLRRNIRKHQAKGTALA